MLRRGGERVALVDQDVGAVPAEVAHLEVVGDGERQRLPVVHEGEVMGAGRDRVDGVPGVDLVGPQDDVRRGRAQAADGAHDDPPVRRGERRESHRPDRLTAVPVEPGLESLHVREQGPRRVGERATGLGEQDTAPLPFEQLHPRLGLEALDLLGHRARGVVERGRGGADGAVRLDGDERTQRDRIDHAAMLHIHEHNSLMDVNGRAAPTMRTCAAVTPPSPSSSP